MADECPGCPDPDCEFYCECEPFPPCSFCGDPDCDGSGYNCGDNYYQDYNLLGWPDD